MSLLISNDTNRTLRINITDYDDYTALNNTTIAPNTSNCIVIPDKAYPPLKDAFEKWVKKTYPNLCTYGLKKYVGTSTRMYAYDAIEGKYKAWLAAIEYNEKQNTEW